MSRFVLLLAVMTVIAAAGAWLESRYLRRRRARYERAHRPEHTEGRFEPLIEQCRAAFGATLVRQPPVSATDLAGITAAERLEAAVELCAARFGVDRARVVVSYSHDLPPHAGADATWETQLEAVYTDGELALRWGEEPVLWQIRVRFEYAQDSAMLLAYVAHEMAHVALRSRGVWLSDVVENELLTETAAILAGFGPVMRDSAYREYWYERVGRDTVTGIVEAGYLHQFTIDYIMHRRSDLAAQDDCQPTRSAT